MKANRKRNHTMDTGGILRDRTLRIMARKPHRNMVVHARPIPFKVFEGIFMGLFRFKLKR